MAPSPTRSTSDRAGPGGGRATGAGYRAVYDALSACYDRKASARYYRSVLSWLEARLRPGSRVLDVGCGTGRYAVALADRGFEVMAIDESPEMVARARAKAGAERIAFRVADAVDGLPAGPFDAVLLIDAWEFVTDPAKILWNARGIVREGGGIIIITPNPAWRWPITVAEWFGIKRLAPAYGYGNGNRRVIQVAALAAGLAVREMTSLYGTLARATVLDPSVPALPLGAR